MKQIISLLFIITLGITNISCSDDNEPTENLVNTHWSYQQPHFKFEYTSDTIVFQMMQKQIKMTVSQLKGMFMAMAQEKMSAYFKGIDFNNDNTLFINIQNKQQKSFQIPAQYTCDENYLQLTMNMGNMMSGSNIPLSDIPPISFKYQVKNNQMTMYFEKVYIQVIYSIMSDSIASMIVKAMGMDFSHAPEGMEAMAIQAIQKQLDEIIQQIQRLEVGFVMNLK